MGKINLTTAEIQQRLTDVPNKVDKVSGKGLSTSDYTAAEKTKLDGIATGAQKNVAIKHKSVAIAVATWTGSAAPYSATVTDADIVDGCLLTVLPAQASQDTAVAAGIYNDITTAVGSFTLKAKAKPTAAITIKYTIQL
jgi:hypothetical protein